MAISQINTNSIATGAVDATDLASTLDLTGKTVTLPAGVGGKVLQVVSVTKTDTYSESVARGAIASNDAISASITPTSASSKILIISSLNVSSSNANRVATVLYKGGSVISAYTGDASGNRGRVSSAGSISQTYFQTSISSNYLDSPNTTSSTTYSFRLRHGAGETQTVYLNAPGLDDNENYQMRAASTITLLEIAV